MSLDFYYKEMADGGDCLWNEDGTSNMLCYAITFGLMFAEMGGITEKNASEVYARIHTVEKLIGALRVKHGDANNSTTEIFVTPDEVKQCIGLTVNVPEVSRTKFMNGIVKHTIDEFKRGVK